MSSFDILCTEPEEEAMACGEFLVSISNNNLCVLKLCDQKLYKTIYIFTSLKTVQITTGSTALCKKTYRG